MLLHTYHYTLLQFNIYTPVLHFIRSPSVFFWTLNEDGSLVPVGILLVESNPLAICVSHSTLAQQEVPLTIAIISWKRAWIRLNYISTSHTKQSFTNHRYHQDKKLHNFNMLLGLLVAYRSQHIHLEGQFLRNPHRIKDTLRLPKNLINLLERATSRLRIEEAKDNSRTQTDAGIDNIIPPVDTIEADGGDFRDEKVKQPVRRGSHGRDLCAGLQGRDLGGVHERDEEQADEEPDEGEEVEQNRSRGGTCILQV